MTNEINDHFVFYTNNLPFDEREDFIAHIPASITDVEKLFQVLYESLELPSYFGFNWDALSDCLRDLGFIEQYRVVILHHDLPQLPKKYLFMYLEVVHRCVWAWKPGDKHQLIVAFPKDVEVAVLRILKV